MVHADVEGVEALAGDELEVWVPLDGLEVVGLDVVDAVHGARLELDELLARLG